MIKIIIELIYTQKNLQGSVFILVLLIKRGKNLHLNDGITFDDVLIIPVRSSISSRKEIDTSTKITKNIRLNIPVLSSAMDSVTESEMAIGLGREGGLGVIHRFLTIEEQCNEVLKVKNADPYAPLPKSSVITQEFPVYTSFSSPVVDKNKKLLCCAAVGLKDTMERSSALVNAGCDVLCFDIAHGHCDDLLSAIRKVKKEFDIDIIAGNIATAEAAEDLISAGADCVKVGIGPGSTCITRIVTGCGVPQLTAVSWAAEICRNQNAGLIADGGMRCSGDLVKALAAGADAGMFGGLFSGTNEAASKTVNENGKTYKLCRGMASMGAMKKRLEVEVANGNGNGNGNGKRTAPEGTEIKIPCIGSVHDLVSNIEAGLRSGMSYCNAHNLQELKTNAKFVKITPATQVESRAHSDFWV